MAWDADNNAEPPGQRLPSAAETLGVENDSSLHYSEAYLWLKYGQLPSHRYNFGFESKAVLAQAIADAMSIGYNRGLDAR
jgi:hypothetical protein